MFVIKMLLTLILVLTFTGTALAQGYTGLLFKGYMFIPLRGVFEELGCQVNWDGSKQTVYIKNNGQQITLVAGSKQAHVSGDLVLLQEPAQIKDGKVYVPLRFCAEAIGAEVNWDQVKNEALIAYQGKQLAVKPAVVNNYYNSKIIGYQKNINGITAKVVEIPKGSASAAVVLGQNKVGGTESLASMASRSGAVVAINGTYFEAYGGIPEPWGTLINKGRVLHVGSVGTTVGVTANGRLLMDPMKIKIEGAINDSYQWPNNWYAYGFNHTPSETGVYIYTAERGAKTGSSAGTSVIVADGLVTKIVRGENAAIPVNGFVINFTGREENLAGRFNVGDKVSYRVTYENIGADNWDEVIAGVGAGPRLVKDGYLAVDPQGEGFTSPKILEMGGARSAIGVKTDGTIILATVPGATIEKLAVVMQKLGAVNAMNLDGGASSGLWLRGKYLTTPGRLISNALIFK